MVKNLGLLSGHRGCEAHKRKQNRKKTFAPNLRQTRKALETLYSEQKKLN
jgi:hypothetical protein